MPAQLDIVIVNWNSNTQLMECLNSIPQTLNNTFELKQIIIVDNASTDISLQGVHTLPLPIVLIQNTENKGFAYACNQGSRRSEADYLLFLNPDTRMYPNSLSIPLEFMEQPRNKNIGILGIQLLDEHQHIAKSCARFPTTSHYVAKAFGLERFFETHFMQEWDHLTNKEVDQVMGAFFLVRRNLYQQLEGFDERFFVYFEEVDFALRAKKSGWLSYYLAEAQIFHRGGGTSQQVKAKRLYYHWRSRMQYSFKHFNFFSACLLLTTTLFVEPFGRCTLALAKGSRLQVKETIEAYKMFWKSLFSS